MTEPLVTSETDMSKGKSCKSRKHRSKCKPYMEAMKFNNVSPSVFYSSQWPIPDYLFLIYKAAVAIYTIVVIICSIRGFDHALRPRRPWPCWLTNWSYLMVSAYSVSSFVIVAYNYVTKYKISKLPVMKNPPLYVKITWALYAMALPLSYLVTIVFFVALFPRKNLDFIPPGDVHTHLMNSVLTTLELFLGALPVRVFHIVYSVLFGLAYMTFSVFYWLYDPPNNVLYPGVLDWSDPQKTIRVLAFMYLIMAPLIHLVQYVLFNIRVKLHALIFRNNFGEDSLCV